jgi:hypothetical protein
MAVDAIQLIGDYLDGELDAVRNDEFRAWLEADQANVRSFVRHLFMHQQLRQQLLAQNVERSLASAGGSIAESDLLPKRGGIISSRFTAWSYPAIAILLLIGAMIGSWVTRQVDTSLFSGASATTDAGPDGAGQEMRAGRAQLATLVSVANCRWDQMLSTADVRGGSRLRSGESLHLLEGVAEIRSTMPNGGVTTIQVEGPLAMNLSSQGILSILYGHLTGLVTCDHDVFTLDTPLGRIRVSKDASFGVIAAANKVELHVFAGAATLEPWSIGLASGGKQWTATKGGSLLAAVGSDGDILINRDKSKESWFMTPAALAASRLHISDEYVATILGGKPIAYWRFEGDVSGVMRNEVQDRYHCQMVGDAVRWHGREGNGRMEFGFTAGPGYLISKDAMDGAFDERYSLEAWVKPAYFHHGVLFSLLDWDEARSPHGSHCLHLELCGPVSGFGNTQRVVESYPGRIRFIHATSNCFSSAPYQVRKWQHLAVTKESSTLRLYCDGQQVGSVQDERTISGKLRILMGQLYPRSPLVDDEVTSRLFVGELDEVAFYDRVLTEEEIRKHIAMVRLAKDAPRNTGGEEL